MNVEPFFIETIIIATMVFDDHLPEIDTPLL